MVTSTVSDTVFTVCRISIWVPTKDPKGKLVGFVAWVRLGTTECEIQRSCKLASCRDVLWLSLTRKKFSSLLLFVTFPLYSDEIESIRQTTQAVFISSHCLCSQRDIVEIGTWWSGGRNRWKYGDRLFILLLSRHSSWRESMWNGETVAWISNLFVGAEADADLGIGTGGFFFAVDGRDSEFIFNYSATPSISKKFALSSFALSSTDLLS